MSESKTINKDNAIDFSALDDFIESNKLAIIHEKLIKKLKPILVNNSRERLMYNLRKKHDVSNQHRSKK
jgi:hypothetical protein